METTNVFKRIAPSTEAPIALKEEEYLLNIMMVSQDPTTREWATELWGRVTQFVGEENLHIASWKVSDLAQPKFFTDAVWSAVRADVIVVAVSATEELPLDLYVWIDAWLPRRARGTGALMALIGLPEAPNHQASHVQEYLQAVARKGQLEFLPRKRMLPVASADFSGRETVRERAEAVTSVLAGIVGDDHDYNAYAHWGLNE